MVGGSSAGRFAVQYSTAVQLQRSQEEIGR